MNERHFACCVYLSLSLCVCLVVCVGFLLNIKKHSHFVFTQFNIPARHSVRGVYNLIVAHIRYIEPLKIVPIFQRMESSARKLPMEVFIMFSG